MGYLLLAAVFVGISFALASKATDSWHNLQVRKKLEDERGEFEGESAKRLAIIQEREALLDSRDRAFHVGIPEGRKWLARMIADADRAADDERERSLRNKKNPARAAAEVVKEVQAEKREVQAALKALEFQLRSYEEYFPILEEYREVLEEERIQLLSGQDNLEALESADPALRFVSREEYERRSSAERNQLALDRYLTRPMTQWQIGRHYERYLGYLRESSGWKVLFQGALLGYEDFGRDLVCMKNGVVEIVQAKCWSRHKVIREKHLFQVFGTSVHYRLANGNIWVNPVLATTASLSDEALLVAEVLKIKIEKIELPRSWPLVKCNVSPNSAQGIYHLPFDQQYDRVAIGLIQGEKYVSTVQEAEDLGFRHAWRWRGNWTA